MTKYRFVTMAFMLLCCVGWLAGTGTPATLNSSSHPKLRWLSKPEGSTTGKASPGRQLHCSCCPQTVYKSMSISNAKQDTPCVYCMAWLWFPLI